MVAVPHSDFLNGKFLPLAQLQPLLLNSLFTGSAQGELWTILPAFLLRVTRNLTRSFPGGLLVSSLRFYY